jgi:TRAP-type mannitol/chloroaromatic compound transport system permease small subunit
MAAANVAGPGDSRQIEYDGRARKGRGEPAYGAPHDPAENGENRGIFPVCGELSIDGGRAVRISFEAARWERRGVGHEAGASGLFCADEGNRVGSTFDWSLRALLPVSRSIDAFNQRLGKWVSWLILAMVLISATNATVRKVFDTSSNAWLELQWVLFSVVFLLCAPWTLLVNEHIRIDIVNNMLPKPVRNVIDVVGHAFFLLPLCLIMVVTGLPFFIRSYEINEQSMNAGGLPQWPAKSLVLLGFFFLLIQGLSELVKRLAITRGLIPDTETHTAHEVVIEEAKRLIEDIKTGTEAH